MKKTTKILLWNTEGAKNALPYLTREMINEMDIIVATETFLLEPINIQGLYGIHTYATPTEGRLKEESPVFSSQQ